MDLEREGRILYMSSVDISLPNGPGVNEREFIAELTRVFGDRAHFLIPRPARELPELDFDNRFTFTLPHRGHRFYHYYQHQRSQLRLADRLLAAGGYNLLVFRIDVLPFSYLQMARTYNIPYVIKTLGAGGLNVLQKQSGLRSPVGHLLQPANNYLYRKVVNGALAVDVCTERYITYFQERLGLSTDKIKWVENATNIERFSTMDSNTARSQVGLEDYEPIIGYIGGSPAQRGGRQMIDITPDLLDSYPDLGVVIVGNGSGLDGLRKRAGELGIIEHCCFPGQVPYEQVPLYINSFDVGFSFDLESRTSVIGNSSQKVRQYLACGKPVVASPGGNSFLQEEQLGLIVDTDNLDEIIDAVSSWVSLAHADRDSLRERAIKYARKYLSTTRAMKKRLEFWQDKLDNQE